MSAFSIVQSLHGLSKDPDHREHIVRDQGCLAVLVMLLGSNESEDEVVSLCLETLEMLSQNTNNKQTMLVEPGLESTLKKYQQNDKFKIVIEKILFNIKGGSATTELNETTKIQSSADSNNIPTSTTLYTSIPSKKTATSFSMLVGEKLPIKDSTQVKSSSVATSTPSVLSKPQPVDPSLIKTLTLHVKGMNNESSKKQMEDCLLRTKGVISFMIDLNQCQATIRTALSSDEIKLVIRNNVGLSASLIVDGVEEVESTPDYLPEPYSNGGNNNQSKKGWGWNSIISFGAQEEQKTGQWGWGSFSKVLFG